MLVMGVDPSARKIAVVAYAPLLKVPLAQSFMLYNSREKQTSESLGKALTCMGQVRLWVDQVAPRGERYAWVEDPLVGRGGTTATMKQAFVGGIIRASLVEAGFSVYGVNVSTWKKRVCGNGRALKPDVLRCVKTQWPKVESLIGNDGDLADAAAICLFGQTTLKTAQFTADAGLAGRRVRLPRP